MANVPNIQLNNGKTMPALGLGTWQAVPGQVEAAVKLAIDLGYRHFDCATVYMNEAEVGKAIREKISDGTVKREDLFITSKLWSTFHKRTSVVPQIQTSLEAFGLEYLDLYLIHWPFSFQEIPGNYFPRDSENHILESDDDFVDTWKGMEECVTLGLTKSIGVSNFNSQQLTRLLKVATIKPVTNQVECHPYLNQKQLTAWCKEREIVITAYSPLGSPARPWAQSNDPILIDDPKIKEIAEKLGKTPAQIILKYLVHLGVIPIPKSTNAVRLKENIDVFDWTLDDDDITVLNQLDCNGRFCLFGE